MRNAIRSLAALGAALLLAGCTVSGELDSKDTVYLAPALTMTLPAPEFPGRFERMQLLHVTYRDAQGQDRHESVLVNVALSPSSVSLTAMSALGSRLFELSYARGEDVVVTSFVPLSGAGLDPRQVLLDMMLGFCDASVLAAYLPADVKITDGGTKRVLTHGGQLLYEIEYVEDQGVSIPKCIANLTFGYQIDIETLS